MAASANPPCESLLIADLGRGSSRAYLLEQIGGSFRFVAKPKVQLPPSHRLKTSRLAGINCCGSSSGSRAGA